ncbi:MAG: hypothetical protein ACOWWH_12450 [Eubacteriaceae bacterium]
MESRSIATLTQLPTTKTEIETYVSSLKNDIIGGYISAEESALILKSFEEVITQLKKDEDIKSYLYSELEKYTEKTVKYQGCEITKASRTIYDYSSDEEYASLKEQEQEIKQYIKAREIILKGGNFPSKTSEYLTIKLAKK